MAESLRHIRKMQESIREYIILNTETVIYEMSVSEDFNLLKNPIVIQSLITGVSSMLDSAYYRNRTSDTVEYLKDLVTLLNQHLDHYMSYGFSDKIFTSVCQQILLCNTITRPFGIFKRL